MNVPMMGAICSALKMATKRFAWWGWQHPHCNAFDLVGDKVPKVHPVVPHNKGHCFNNRVWVLGSKPIMGCGSEEVFLDAGNAVLCVNVSVHTNCIVSEEQCIRREREFVEFFLEFRGVLEICQLPFHDRLKLLIYPLPKGLG